MLSNTSAFRYALTASDVNAYSSIVKNVVTSVWEAEINAVNDGIDTMMYATGVCSELKYPYGSNRRINVDSQSAIDWLYGENISTNTKHVGVKLHRLREVVKNESFKIEYVKSNENISDILTKQLSIKDFERLRGELLGHGLLRKFKNLNEIETLEMKGGKLNEK